MQELNRKTVPTSELPIKILQFGEGNFLRAFADWMIDKMNAEHSYNSGVAVVQPIAQGMVELLQKQDNLYHHIYRGLVNGKAASNTQLISCIQKSVNPFKNKKAYDALALLPELQIVISNTTEAGITFNEDDKPVNGALAVTFPGKITQLLWSRFKHFRGAPGKGLKFIPVELIKKNGEKLKEAVLNYAELWNLTNEFANWITNDNYFANTLVDRIVPGYPKEEAGKIQSSIGFNDNLIVSSEVFHLWVIKGPKEIQQAFPANKCGLNVIYTNNLTPYRTRKVRILNGAHTCMVPVGLLNGIETVKECAEGKWLGRFVHQIIFDEIAPTIDLPDQELEAYAKEVLERFKNPFIRHELTSIALNSVSKYKVRVLPSLLDYYNTNNKLPIGLVLAFTHLIKLYLTDTFSIKDSDEVKAFFNDLKAGNKSTKHIIYKVLANLAFWDTDLNLVTGLPELMTSQMSLLNNGIKLSDFMVEEV
ncbi:MAG: tagaturonate reductase [Cyclobacteriaceae bacterium]|nr:tagaturonate reductase [Cyclobacteriaceae bacterium]